MASAASEQPDGGGDRFTWPPSKAEWPSFYHYWRGVILRVCARRGLDPHTAEDVVQNVMTSLNELAQREDAGFPNIKALGRFVTLAATRQSDREREKARRQQPIVAGGSIPDHRQRDRFVAEFRDLVPPEVPDEQVLGWLLNRVSDNRRELFRLKYDQGMRWDEVSERLGRPISTLFGWHQAELSVLRRGLERDAT